MSICLTYSCQEVFSVIFLCSYPGESWNITDGCQRAFSKKAGSFRSFPARLPSSVNICVGWSHQCLFCGCHSVGSTSENVLWHNWKWPKSFFFRKKRGAFEFPLPQECLHQCLFFCSWAFWKMMGAFEVPLHLHQYTSHQGDLAAVILLALPSRTLVTKLTMADAGCSRSYSANRWHTLSVRLPGLRATKP